MIMLPMKYRIWTDGRWHLYFDPNNVVCVRVNDDGKRILDLLDTFMPSCDVAAVISSQYSMPLEDAGALVETFVSSLIDAGFLHKDRYVRKQWPQTHPEFPHDVYLHLTNKCNLKCSYCYNKADRLAKLSAEAHQELEVLSTEEFKGVIRQIIDGGSTRILFTGGEALLREDILELLAFARELSNTQEERGGSSVHLELLTNAMRVSESNVAVLVDLLDSIKISLDGHERDLHEAERGPHAFAMTLEGIKRLVAARTAAAQKRPFICIAPVLTDRNVDYTADIYKFALEELKADSVLPTVFQAGSHQELSLARMPDVAAYDKAKEGVRRYLKERDLANGVTLPPPVPHAKNHCGVGSGEISIDPNGNVYPCQSLHFDAFHCGNVREQSLMQIFAESSVMQKMRGTTVDAIDGCRHCDLQLVCGGGCRATTYNLYGSVSQHNRIYCKMEEAEAIKRLWDWAPSQQ